MSPPSWAFQLENFRQPPHEELICSICQLVFCEPVECPCNHVYCSGCIRKWIRMHRNCPICRQRTSASVLRPVNRIINNLINGLKLRCKNATSGCDCDINIESCEAHIKVCPHEMMDCPNKCGASIKRKDIAQHKENECPYRECKVCGLMFEPGMTEHNCIETMKAALDGLKNDNSALEDRVKKLQEELDQMKERYPLNSNRDNDLNISSDFWFPGLLSLNEEMNAEIQDTTFDDENHDFSLPSSSSSPSSSSFDLTNLEVVPCRRYQINDLGHFEPLSLISSDTPELRAASGASRDWTYHSEASAEADSASHARNADPTNTRRPAKRRIAVRSSNSSDDGDEAGARTRKSHQSSSDDSDETREHSHRSDRQEPNIPRLRSRRDRGQFRSRSADDCTLLPFEAPGPTCSAMPSSSSSQMSSDNKVSQSKRKKIFGRTLALLQQYDSESDHEWIPKSECNSSTESDSTPITTTTTSSSSETSEEVGEIVVVPTTSSPTSESSYEVEVPTPTYDLLQRYCTYDTDSDPDWTPMT